jgi:myosin heavy subunit
VEDDSVLPTEFIIKGERLTRLIGVGDEVPQAAIDFMQEHNLSESLLHTIERELWTTQLELCRRFIAHRESQVEKQKQEKEMARLSHEQALRRASELENALSNERTQHKDLESQIRSASEALCSILGTSVGEDQGSISSLKKLVDAVVARHDVRESKIAAVERDCEVLREQQSHSHRQLQSLKQNLEVVTSGLDEAKRRARQAEMQAIEQHQAVLQERNAHAGQLQAKCDRLTRDLEQRMTALDAAQEATLKAEQKADDFAKKHELMKHNVREAASQKQSWETRISTLMHENKQMKLKLDEREVQNQKLQAKVLDATGELRKLQRAIGTALATATATGQRVTLLEGILNGAVDLENKNMTNTDSNAMRITGGSTYTEKTGFSSPRHQAPSHAGRGSTTPRSPLAQQQLRSPNMSKTQRGVATPAGNVSNQVQPVLVELTAEQQIDLLKQTVRTCASSSKPFLQPNCT